MAFLQRVLDSRRFRGWVQRQQHEAIGDRLLDAAWPGTSATILLMIAGATGFPGAAALFHMHPWRASFSLVPMLVAALVIRFTLRRRFERTTRDYLIVAAGAFAVDFIPAGLIAACEPPGSFVFVAMSLFAAAYHGWAFRASPADTWFHVALFLCPIAAFPLAVSPGAGVVLLVTAPAAGLASWAAGRAGMRSWEAELERERLREAVRAQLLVEETARAARLHERVVGLLGLAHDLGNTVTLAAFDLDGLDFAAQDERLTAAEVRPHLEALRRTMQRLHAQSTALRELGAEGEDARITVEAGLVVQDTLAGFRERHPGLRVDCELASPAFPVRIGGGEESLRRILDNLLANAVQGDGGRGAGRVLLRAESDDALPMVRLVVEDDGPGFSPALLEAPIRAFSTTKRNGTGLGLFTCERLVSASGGALTRGRSALGGAKVEVLLALAPASSGARAA